MAALSRTREADAGTAQTEAPQRVLRPVLGELDGLLSGDLAEDRLGQAVLVVKREARAYLDAIGVIVVAIDAQGRILFLNRNGCELLGCEGDRAILGTDWIETFIPERLHAATREVLEALWAGEAAWAGSNENEVVTRSGEERTVAWRNEVLRDADGTAWAVIGSGIDVTEQRRAERAEQQSEARRRALVEALPDFVVLISPDGTVLEVQEPIAGPFLLRASAVGCSVREAFSEDMAARLEEALAQVVALGGPRTLYLEDDGSVFETRLVRVQGEGCLAVFRDVTERHRLEAEVLRATDEERRRLGRDLHDGLGSHLVGLGMLTRSLARDARRTAPAFADELEEVARLLREGAEQSRTLARGLNPVGVEGDGLVVALDHLASSTETRTGVRCTFDAPTESPPLRAEVAVQLYRIAQEAVTNALRHAEATHIVLTLRAGGGAVLLTVEDDGRGLGAAEHRAHSGLGLQTMAYRARTVGGVFEIKERPEGGTVVVCRLARTEPE